MTYTREEIAAACRKWGKMLFVPEGMDGARLLWALSGCESSFGIDCAPRHERAYDVGGEFAANPEQAALLKQYGDAAACSYGPWQLMLVNAGAGSTPQDMAELDRCAMETVCFINTRILDQEKAETVEQVAEAYNSGKWAWDVVPVGVALYAKQCRKYYDGEPMPAQ